jgi:outer membrane receptor protein involved in Fe transport
MILNVGAEYREEIYNFSPDYVWENGYAGGGNGIAPPTTGEFHVWEAFTEFSLPLVDDKPGIQNLGFEGGYRYSNYSTGINTNTFKLGLEWAPIKDVRVRGSYNRAVRAPNIEELYAGQTVGAGGSTDLCWGPKPSYTAAQCALTGVTASQYGNILVNQAAQINTLTGGNANLKPETADTYTFGVVVQPQAIPNLIVSLDYYNIKIANTITELSSTTVQADCMTIDQSLCHYIQRAAGGSLWLAQTGYVSTQYLNIGEVKTSGADLTSSYRLPLASMGKLNFTLTGSYLHDFTTQPDPNAGSYDCAGLFGTTCGAPLPKWRHVFVADWATPWHGLNLMAKWRYIGAVNVDYTSSNPQLAGAYNNEYSHYSAYNYLDVSASMPIAAGVSFRLGINNVADKDPPISPNGTYSSCPNTSCNDNTWVGTYDSLGRYIYGHITVQF